MELTFIFIDGFGKESLFNKFAAVTFKVIPIALSMQRSEV